MAVFLIKSLYRSGIIDQSYNHSAVLRIAACIDKYTITVKYSDIYHRVAMDIQNEGLSLRHHIGRDREILFYVFFGKNGQPGGHSAYDRKTHHFRSHHLKSVITYLDCPGFCRVTSNIAVFFQSFQMRMD